MSDRLHLTLRSKKTLRDIYSDEQSAMTEVLVDEPPPENEDPTIWVKDHVTLGDVGSVGTGEPVEVLDTAYGRIIISSTDPFQGSWLGSSGVAADDTDVCAVRALLAERPLGTFVDVGASFGCWSLALAHDVSKVVAVEPQLAIYNMLCGSVALNGLSRRVFPLHRALGAALGSTRILALDPEGYNNFGCVSLKGQVPDGLEDRFTDTVDVVPLRALVGSDEHVSFIKIDVEGYEFEVLKGALEVIARCKPVMYVEWALSDEYRLSQQIQAMGYAIEYRKGDWLCVPLD